MISADLGPQLEGFVAKLVETGRTRPAAGVFARLEAQYRAMDRTGE